MKLWSPQAIATIDMLYCLVAGLIVLMAEPQPEVAMADKATCRLAVDIEWTEGVPVDVDLWVAAPDKQPVGYSAKQGRIFNLVRDDRGSSGEGEAINSERACAIAIPDGPYAANIHLYSSGLREAVPVKMTISYVDPVAAVMTTMATREVALTKIGEEITVLRWRMQGGKLVEVSVNHIPIPLRTQ